MGTTIAAPRVLPCCWPPLDVSFIVSLSENVGVAPSDLSEAVSVDEHSEDCTDELSNIK